MMDVNKHTIKYHTPKDYLNAAKSIDTLSSELRELAKAPYGFVLTAVAGNPNTDADVLASLVPEIVVSWSQQELAVEIAKNNNADAETLSLLAKHLIPVLDNGRNHQKGFSAGIHLCNNTKTPIATIKTLLQSERIAMQFRKVLARESIRLEVLEILLNDRSETVKNRAKKTIKEIKNP